jgi:hypothetical protein
VRAEVTADGGGGGCTWAGAAVPARCIRRRDLRRAPRPQGRARGLSTSTGDGTAVWRTLPYQSGLQRDPGPPRTTLLAIASLPTAAVSVPLSLSRRPSVSHFLHLSRFRSPSFAITSLHFGFPTPTTELQQQDSFRTIVLPTRVSLNRTAYSLHIPRDTRDYSKNKLFESRFLISL